MWLGLRFYKGKLAPQVIDLPNKSPEVYLKTIVAPLFSLVVDYYDVDEAKDSLLSVVPRYLGRFSLRFPFPFSSLILTFPLQVILELRRSHSILIQDLLAASIHP